MKWMRHDGATWCARRLTRRLFARTVLLRWPLPYIWAWRAISSGLDHGKLVNATTDANSPIPSPADRTNQFSNALEMAIGVDPLNPLSL